MIQHILFPVAIGLLFAEFSGIPQKISRWLLKKYKIGVPSIPYTGISGFSGPIQQRVPYRLKPFDCGMCLSFWIAIIQNYCLHYTVYDILALAAASGCVAYLTMIIVSRIKP